MCCGHSAIAASAEPGVGLEVITRAYIVQTPVAMLLVHKTGGWRLAGQALVRHTSKLLSFAKCPLPSREEIPDMADFTTLPEMLLIAHAKMEPALWAYINGGTESDGTL